MVVVRKLALVLLLVSALVLAGCTGGGAPEAQSSDGDVPAIEATATTGGIRGVVVDDRITPIKGARVEVLGAGKNMTTTEDGTFAFSGLAAGDYVVKASHDLYSIAQATATVVAGDAEPKAVKIQLIRSVFANPYLETLAFDGFIVCSANAVLPLLGGLLSEECGEGAGAPEETCDIAGGPCVPVPVVGGQRIGGQGNNNVQFDFTVSDGARSLVVEQDWEATSAAGSALYSPISLDWACDPFCGGNTFATIEGPSPTYTFIGNDTIDPLNLTSDMVISIFTWASPDTTPIGVTLNQKFTDYVTVFYYLPAPEGWSFINGSPNPFI